MSWPQWTWIVLVGLAWVIDLCRHGEPKTGKHDLGITTAGIGVTVFLLWRGGFFG
jgi:hypothetical protein